MNKKSCPSCEGSGIKYITTKNKEGKIIEIELVCTACGGKGYITKNSNS